MSEEKEYIDFIEKVNQSSGKNIKHPKVIISLIKTTILQRKESDFDTLIFLSKFVHKLHKILLRNTNEKKDQIKSEFQIHIEKIKDIITSFYNLENEKHLIKPFLLNTNESFLLFMELLEDLSIIKDYQIDNKKLW